MRGGPARDVLVDAITHDGEYQATRVGDVIEIRQRGRLVASWAVTAEEVERAVISLRADARAGWGAGASGLEPVVQQVSTSLDLGRADPALPGRWSTVP